jgi:glycosyltransferase involved in cell wall biosynthesis
MRIGIDGRELRENRRGIGRYVWELSRELDRCLPQAEFLVYNRTPVELPVDSERWTLRTDPSVLGRRLSPLLWLKLRAGSLCRRDRLDVFWGAAVFLPRLPQGVRTVVSVYDLCHLFTPETFDPLHLRGVRLFFDADVHRADVLLTISRGTADRLRRHVGREVDAIVTPSVTPEFQCPPDEVVERCRERYGLREPYILTVAAWEPRKNLPRLAEAFLDLKRQGRLPRHRLVLVGQEDPRGAEALLALLRDGGVPDILSLGYVPDVDLPSLYAGADVFVLASTYEGFGIPVLEARACGARVVATDISELREAGGDATIYVAPTLDGIQRGIVTALERDRPSPTPAVPSWEQGARILAKALSAR